MYGVVAWTLRKVDQKYLGSFEMWCWKRMEKVNWIDRVKSEGTLPRVKEERSILHTIKRKDNWNGYILCRNCPIIFVTEWKIEGRTEGMERRGTRSNQLLGELKRTGSYWKLKEEALGHSPWRTRFVGGYGRDVRLTTCRQKWTGNIYWLSMSKMHQDPTPSTAFRLFYPIYHVCEI